MRPDLKRTQQQRNIDTVEAVELFEPHRQNVMRLIDASARDLSPDDQSLCEAIALLGIGNGNDIDLKVIADQFRKDSSYRCR